MAQDRPTARELVEAVIEFIERDVMTIEGRVGFHGRVARNVLAVVARELEDGDELDVEERNRLVALLGRDTGESTREMEAELASRIRSGELDDRLDEVAQAVRQTVLGKLSISNPGYAHDPDVAGGGEQRP